MTQREIQDVRSRSKAAQNGPWVTDFGEMARKTVVRRAAKYWPLSPELADASEHDARTDSVVFDATLDGVDAPAETGDDDSPQQTQADRILEKLAAIKGVKTDG
jgi:recombination protein RecT